VRPYVADAAGVIMLVFVALSPPAYGFELLSNGGFESGTLSGWDEVTGAGHVVTTTAGDSCVAINPGSPRSGSYFFSSATVDGAIPLTPEIALRQVIDVSSFPEVAAGTATVRATGYVAGAPGCSTTSDDLAFLAVEFYQGGSAGTLLASYETPGLDPTVGAWNYLSTGDISVPEETDTIVFYYRSLLDPGFASIDLGADDLSLILDSPATDVARDTQTRTSWTRVKLEQ
jgi:hypothetical protein